MCVQIVERFPVCECVYYVHKVDVCPEHGRKRHKVQQRNIYVGSSCAQHQSQSSKAKLIPTSSPSRKWTPGTYSDSGSSKYKHSIASTSKSTRDGKVDLGGAISKSSLRAQILEKTTDSHAADEDFIPAGHLLAVLTTDAVEQELHHHQMGRLFPQVINDTKKLFAILVVIGRMDALPWMVKAGLSDKDLPLKPYGHLEKDQPYSRFFSSFAEWDVTAQKQLMDAQWMFLAPVFKDDEHQILDDSIRLPFINLERIGAGSHSEVHRLTIHVDHSEMKMPSVPPTSEGQLFALKHFILPTRDANLKMFSNEMAIMKSLKGFDDDHITKVLASFEHKGDFLMILPLAEENLRQFWAHALPASFSLNWYLEEMIGVSSGLSVLHQASCWHGDLKPENILIFKDAKSRKQSFRLCDFGSSYIHPTGSKSELPPYPGSGTYEPPECQLNQNHSRKYDIWSLGCIFLECIGWALKGSEAIERFADDRLRDTSASDENFRSDYFFSLKLDDSLKPSGAQIRPAVLRWIEALDRDPNCRPAISRVLHLIRDELLQVQQDRRPEASEVSQSLVRYVAHSVDNNLLSGSAIS